MLVDNEKLQSTLNSRNEEVNGANTTVRKYQIDIETLKKRLADY